MSLKLGNQTISGISTDTIKNARHLLEPFWSDHILNDVNCLRADQFSWQNGEVYVSAYNHLVNDIEDKTLSNTYLKSNVILYNYLQDNKGVLDFSRPNSAGIPHATLPMKFNTGSSTWEYVIKCKTVDTFVQDQDYDLSSGPEYGQFIIRVRNSKFYLYASNDGSTFNIVGDVTGTYTVQTGTVYWIKLEFTGTQYILSYSLDGITYTPDIMVTSSLTVVQGKDIYLGCLLWQSTLADSWCGTIYLSDCYLKVGDNITWQGTDKIYYYQADDGHRICPVIEHDKIAYLYNTEGVAWYYILDTANNRFKLPRTKFGFTGLRDNVGSEVFAGLPNITGSHAGVYNGAGLSGAFVTTNYSSDHTYLATNWVDNTINVSAKYNFDASDSSIIYGNNDTVQPPATQMYLYFYVGEFEVSAIEAQAGEISELVQDKVSKTGDSMTGDLVINKVQPAITQVSPALDKTSAVAPTENTFGAIFQAYDKNNLYVGGFDLSHNINNDFAIDMNIERNVNGTIKNAFLGVAIGSTGNDFVYATEGVKQSITNWVFPSSKYDDLALGVSGASYTASADGYVFLWGEQYDYNGYIFLMNNANGMDMVSQPTNVNNFAVRVFMLVGKGDPYVITYGGVHVRGFKFIYAKGEASNL